MKKILIVIDNQEEIKWFERELKLTTFPFGMVHGFEKVHQLLKSEFDIKFIYFGNRFKRFKFKALYKISKLLNSEYIGEFHNDEFDYVCICCEDKDLRGFMMNQGIEEVPNTYCLCNYIRSTLSEKLNGDEE